MITFLLQIALSIIKADGSAIRLNNITSQYACT